MVKETYLINEAAKEVHVESHVLRYWEEELGLPIRRNEQGHRLYTQEDIRRLISIKNLKDQGLQLKAVKTLLAQAHNDDGGEDDMRTDNPFAQKQMTKISESGEEKAVAVKSSDDIRWSERFIGRRRGTEDGQVRQEESDAAADVQDSGSGMIEIKEMRAFDGSDSEESSGPLHPAAKEQTMRLQYLFQKLIKEAVAANNEEMADHLVERITENVKGDICKELDYQFRLMEERDEERAAGRLAQEDRRSEDYYRRIDELLRQYSAKPPKASKSLFKKYVKQEKQEKGNTVKFEEAIASAKEKSLKEETREEGKADKKQKKEFHFLKRAAEVK